MTMKRRKSANDIFLEQQADSEIAPEPFDNFSEEMEYQEQSYSDIPEMAFKDDTPSYQKTDQVLSQDEINGLLQSTPSPSQQVMGKATIQKNISSISKEKNSNTRKPKMEKYVPNSVFKSSEDLQLEKEVIKVKTTGIIFKKVIVPPNVYVIHTRFGRKEPVTIGLGVSFRFDPNRDSYLIVPAAMQTIGVVANCISKEKQGINVLGYVQWQIEDFSVAYKKLDFSDSRDPLAITNAQLREQAEAAIKDKIATMSVEEVLTDKAPIIEELTSRLKLVAEGQSDGVGHKQEGLGIKIITVQIREAIVCSTTLWEYLQSPFRNEEQKKANISTLAMQDEIKKRELESRKQKETQEAQTNMEIEQIKQKKQTEMIELKFNEDTIRFKKEQEALKNKQKLEEEAILNKMESEKRIREKEQDLKIKNIEIEKVLNQKETELKLFSQKNIEDFEKFKLEAQLLKNKIQTEQELLLTESKNNLSLKYQEELTKIEKLKQEVENLVSTNVVLSDLVQKLPEIAAKMPQIKELKVFQSNGGDPLMDNLTVFIQRLMELISGLNLSKFNIGSELKK